MKLDEFAEILTGTGIPFAYHHFDKPQKLPYGAWEITDEPDFMADDTHYLPFIEGYVEYYSTRKDLAGEEKIKAVLTNNKIPFSFVYESYIEREKMFVVRYSVNFIGG